MRKMVLVVMIGVFSLLDVAYAVPGSESQKKTVTNPHGVGNASMAVSTGMAAVIKDATLPAYQSMKIGEAFEKYRYFKRKTWSETRAATGNCYIDFIGYTPSGWFDFQARREGISARGVEVKFVIYPNGEYGVGMVSRVEVKTDGRTFRYPLADAKSVLDKIYGNKEIVF